jgi:hypothetical protein
VQPATQGQGGQEEANEMTRIICIALALLVLVTSAAQAASFRANQWAISCTSKDERELVMCRFYALGLLDGLILWKANSADPISICVPEEPKERPDTKQIIDVGLAYIQKNPESKYQPIAVVLRQAFEEKWPCIGM